MKRFLLTLLLLTLAAIAAEGQEIFYPSTIYCMKDNPRKTVLYPEGFMARRGNFLSINGMREMPLSEGMDSIRIVDNESHSRSVALDIITADPAAIKPGTKARVLCFGESTTEMRCRSPFNTTEKPRNWVMMAQEQLPAGIELTGNIGHGGWSTYTYLNWPCAAKLDPNTPPSFFKPKAMWYALGLATATGEEFSGSRDQLSLIAVTPFGRYPMDGCRELWELVQLLGRRNGYPAFDDDSAYSGTKAQIKALRDWAEELMDNPINEFYDKKTARKGDHAFSLAAYLKRSGTKAPTHAVINIGINDGDGANSLESSRQCYEKLIDCLGGIPVAHYVNRWPGVCDKSLWPGFLPRQYDINGNTANLLRLQQQWREAAAQRTNLYELDVWHIQAPASQLEEKIAAGVIDCSKNDVHTGYFGIESSAHQVVCWLIHILGRN